MTIRLTDLSNKARERLRKPRTRGRFAPIDAARRQLGLLEVSDANGQAAASWLIDLSTSVIADSRFLAYGTLASHPVADVFTESVRGRSVADAATLSAEQLEALLRDDPLTPAFAEHGLAPLEFVRDLQSRAEAALPHVVLLPKPSEAQQYQRKRKADWTPADAAWLPLSLLAKIARIDAAARSVLAELAPGATLNIDGLHDDLRVVASFGAVPAESAATVALALRDRLRPSIHPDLLIEVGS